MNICEACEQFESRVKQWNYTHGPTDPLPYIGEMIKSHKQLFFEERRIDGFECSTLLFRCLKCNQFWKLLSWQAVGQLDIKPYFPKHNSSTKKELLLTITGVPMKERRQYERFSFSLPIRLNAITTGRTKVIDLYTRDLSVSGTFITTLTSFPEETRFTLDFTIPTDSIKKLKDMKRLNGYTGSMVRSTTHGIAIQFDNECQIESLKAL